MRGAFEKVPGYTHGMDLLWMAVIKFTSVAPSLKRNLLPLNDHNSYLLPMHPDCKPNSRLASRSIWNPISPVFYPSDTNNVFLTCQILLRW